ncbi:MAG: alkaline phosphatase family protein, partial [Endomicrobiales bacterium]
MDLDKLLLLCYIGPGTDLVFSSLGGLLGLVFALLAFCGLLLKRVGGFFKRKKYVLPLALLAAAGAVLALAFILPQKKKDTSMRIIVLGIDGFDPAVAESLMARGRLPHFKSMKETGSFTELATTTPPQSPVAWASFSTGVNPGKHGIFDFLERDPASYLPDLSLMRAEPPKTLRLGPLSIPLGASRLRSPVKAVPFWEITSRERVPTTVLRCPLTFPPGKVNGKMLSGMGTPDLSGTLGTFTFYTTKDIPGDTVTGGRMVGVTVENKSVETKIIGPRDMSSPERVNLSIPLSLQLDGEGDGATVLVQGRKFRLLTGQWSDWVPVEFKVNLYTRARAICRFYLKSASPDLELYLSPMNFDPAHPAFPISCPEGFSRR